MEPLTWVLSEFLLAKLAALFGYTYISAAILLGLRSVVAKCGLEGIVQQVAEGARKLFDLLPSLGGFGLD